VDTVIKLTVELYDEKVILVTEDEDRIDVAFREVLSGMQHSRGTYPAPTYPHLVVLTGPGLSYKGRSITNFAIAGNEVAAVYIEEVPAR
jgi:hypothetical protein